MAIPLLLLLLLAGCPHNNGIETRTLSYNANLPEGTTLASGAAVPATKIYAAGAKVAVAANELTTNEGGIGTGWNTQPDGGGISYSDGEELTLNADTTLYATWALTQRVMSSAEAAEAITDLTSNDSIEILITDSVDFDALKTALSHTSGKVELDLTSASSVTSISNGAFQNATGLVSVTLPNTVTSIGASAFASSGLKSLILEGDASSITTIEQTAIPSTTKIYVPHEQLTAYKNKFSNLNDKFVSSRVTVTVSWTGAGTSGFQTTYQGDIGTFTSIPQSPVAPANFTFVKWVNDNGQTVSLPQVFKENQTIQANALYTNEAGYPVYPAYLTVRRTSYTDAENDDVGQEKPNWAEKIYSQQLVKRPISDPVFTDAFKFGDGSSQIPQRETLTVTAGGDGTSPSHGGVGTGNAKNGGSFRIPALISMPLPSGKTRVFAAMDVRYRGEEDGNGDCGTTNGGSDILILYSDDGGATWPGRKMIDVDNIWDESGKTNTMSHKTDLGDPALWTVGNKLYMGAVGGGPSAARTNMNDYTNTNRVFVSSDYGETWVEDTNISSNNGMAKPRETYSYLWNTKDGNLTNPGNGQGGYANLPCPGHGIILTKDVPNTNMKAGMTAVPMQGGGGTTNFATYIIYGNGEPSTWSKNGSIMVPNSGNGEWQICQLDDGTILSLGKNTNGPIEMRRYSGANMPEGWYTVDSDPWGGRNRGASQTSLLKVADGDGDKKGVVAFASPKQGGANPSKDFQDSGRNQVTVSFAADNSKSVATGEGSPLGDVRYYVQIRKMGQRYFGYTDMVMVDDELIGILYECFDTNNDLDGMRFITIDVSEIIKKLSTQQ